MMSTVAAECPPEYRGGAGRSSLRLPESAPPTYSAVTRNLREASALLQMLTAGFGVVSRRGASVVRYKR
jgi:hypothetical protein